MRDFCAVEPVLHTRKRRISGRVFRQVQAEYGSPPEEKGCSRRAVARERLVEAR